jgi:hypothetical protein
MNQAELKEQILAKLASLKTKVAQGRQGIQDLAQDIKQASVTLKELQNAVEIRKIELASRKS